MPPGRKKKKYIGDPIDRGKDSDECSGEESRSECDSGDSRDSRDSRDSDSQFDSQFDSQTDDYSDEFSNDDSYSDNSYSDNSYSDDSYSDDDSVDSNCEIVFECDGVAVTNKSNFWVHILTQEQWEIVLDNIDRRMFYISAFSHSDIKAGDIILIYQRPISPTKPGGFVAIGEASIDMVENDGTLDVDNKHNTSGVVKVYRDRNMNRFVTRLCTITIFESPIDHSTLEDVITSDSNFKSTRQFLINIIKGDCRFELLPSRDLGLNMIEKLYDESRNQISDSDNEGDDCTSDEAGIISTEFDTELETEIDTELDERFERQNGFEEGYENTSEEIVTSHHLDTDRPDYDEPSNRLQDSEVTIDIVTSDGNINEEGLDYYISPNVPILVVPCSELPKQVNTFKKSYNAVQMIYHHYLHCTECDITNNNSRELAESVKTVGLTNIKYDMDNHVDVLLSYLIDETFPRPEAILDEDEDNEENENNEDSENNTEKPDPFADLQHHITFHRIQNDPIYSECIAIDFTSRIKKVISAQEAMERTKRSKPSSISRIMSKPIKTESVQQNSTSVANAVKKKVKPSKPKMKVMAKAKANVSAKRTSNRIFVRQKEKTVQKSHPNVVSYSKVKYSSRMISADKRKGVVRPNTHAIKRSVTESDKRKSPQSNANSKIKKIRARKI
jgi:hypothetical protein